MSTEEFHDMSAAELRARSSELRKELFNMRMQLYTGQSAKTHHIRLKRRDIARVETILAQKLAAES